MVKSIKPKTPYNKCIVRRLVSYIIIPLKNPIQFELPKHRYGTLNQGPTPLPGDKKAKPLHAEIEAPQKVDPYKTGGENNNILAEKRFNGRKSIGANAVFFCYPLK